jgi:hypothetical protein
MSRVEDAEHDKLVAARARVRKVFSRFVGEPSTRGFREY